MPTRFDSVVIDSADPPKLAQFWAAALGWPVTEESQEETVVEPPDGVPGIPLVIVSTPDAKQGKNRLHLDLASATAADQAATVERLRALGATPADVGQGDVRWVVLADPEGNELCVLEPRPEYERCGPIAAVVLDVTEPEGLAPFWSAATGWPVVRTDGRSASLRPPDRDGPWLELIHVDDPKRGKNRLHIDVAPYADGDQAAEVERLLSLGASHIDIGQGEVRWVVLADPEGNEFCVLTPR
jgi:predicted enzyme related to lactoylglutathione lyase